MWKKPIKKPLNVMNHSMKNSWLLLLLSAAVVQSCSTGHATEEAKEGEARPKEEAKVLEVFPLQKGTLSSSVNIPGELLAFQQVDLYAKVNSFVKKLNVDVGSEVHQGQVLVTMEAPEINAQLLGAESRLKSQEALALASKANYDRLYEASKTPGTVSQNDLDQAMARQKSDQSQLDAAKAAYREVSDMRNYLEIRAPFNGVISARNVSAGAYVGPSGKGSELPLLSLQEQRKLRLVVSVPEAYTSYIKPATKVDFKVKAYPNETFSAQVARQAGALDFRLRAQRTEMDVVNNAKKLLPGMVAEVSLALGSNEENLIVPASAVLNSTRGVYVIKIEGGNTVWIPVKTGRTGEGKTEIFGKVAVGDTLAMKATEEVRNQTPAGAMKLITP